MIFQSSPVTRYSPEEFIILQASNTFPPGTVERWVQIADYINEHRKESTGLPPKTEKQVIKQVRFWRNFQPHSFAGILGGKRKMYFDFFSTLFFQCKAVQTMNVKLPATTQNQLGTALPDEDSWSATEQKNLEDAIKKHKSSDPERWEKVRKFNILKKFVF